MLLVRSSTFFVFFLYALLVATNSFAIPTIKGKSKVSLPTVLKADFVDGDGINNLIFATGNVEVKKDVSAIYADKITYDKNGGIIRAVGHVKVKNIEVGNMLVGEAEVKDDFSSGKFTQSRLFFNDGSYLSSPEVTRETAEITVLKNSIYSFCPSPEISLDNESAGKKRDFASIKTSKTTIDRKNQVMKSSHGFLRFYNIPVLYTPFIKIPLPGKKRESGFLTPSYTKTSNFGIGIKIPYYFNIAPNIDLTTTPQVSLDGKRYIINNELRHNLKYGSYNLNLELANNKIQTATRTTSDQNVIDRTSKQYRWEVSSNGLFDFTKNTGLDFKINTLSDRNYLRDYHFQYLAYTSSKINLDYINGRNYHSVKTIRIQELEDKNNEKAAVFALPVFDSHVESKPSFFKEKFVFTSNLTTINRDDGLQYRRLTGTPEAKIPFNFNGNLFNLGAKFQTDIYSLENNFKNIERNNNYKTTQNNYKPEFSATWHLPLIRKATSTTLMVEPIASFVASSYKKDFNNLPNEDSNSSELTVSNLFVNDRISGFDRNESGERINYGLKSSLFNNYGEFGLTAGQSLRKSNENQDVSIRGFAANNKSNIVGQAMYRAQKYFSITYSFQLDQASYRNDVNQVSTALVFDDAAFYVDYLLIRRTLQNLSQREQVSLSSKFNLGSQWKATLRINRDIILGRNLSRGVTLSREGCCAVFGFSIIENNQSNLIKAQKTFNVTLSFKNL